MNPTLHLFFKEYNLRLSHNDVNMRDVASGKALHITRSVIRL